MQVDSVSYHTAVFKKNHFYKFSGRVLGIFDVQYYIIYISV